MLLIDEISGWFDQKEGLWNKNLRNMKKKKNIIICANLKCFILTLKPVSKIILFGWIHDSTRVDLVCPRRKHWNRWSDLAGRPIFFAILVQAFLVLETIPHCFHKFIQRLSDEKNSLHFFFLEEINFQNFNNVKSKS